MDREYPNILTNLLSIKPAIREGLRREEDSSRERLKEQILLRRSPQPVHSLYFFIPLFI